jgi:adenylylsulfate kinase
VANKSENIRLEKPPVTTEQREHQNNHKGAVLWFTGLSGSGKSTISQALSKVLFQLGCRFTILDGDNVRHGLCSDLGFSPEDRSENIRRIGEVAKLFCTDGNIALCSFISPYDTDRQLVRQVIGKRFIEVFVKCPLDVCAQRDPKGLYKKALAGKIQNFTGLSAPYESPTNADITIHTDKETIPEAVEKIIRYLWDNKILSE